MHVKYASRHALYPVPNVLDGPVLTTVARAAERALRAGVAIVLREFVALRTTDFPAALRAVVVAVRVFVALRDVPDCVIALRWGVVVARETVLPELRDDTPVAVVFADIPDCFCVDDMAPLRTPTVALAVVVDAFCVRLTAAPSRTAASAQPILQQHAAAKSKIFFILVI